MFRALIGCGFVALFLVSLVPASGQAIFKADEAIPSDAIVLFDGKDLSAWTKCDLTGPAPWKVENGYMQVGGGYICTKQSFGDCQLHIEFWLPLMANRTGQARANSGVYLQSLYEVQVLDSHGLKSQSDGCGAIYGVAAPLVNACRPPEHWRSYDIIFRAPKFDQAGKQVSPARMTVLQNGVLIQENVDIPQSTTSAAAGDPKQPGPLMLQDHGCPVRYRNIWIRQLPPKTW